VLRDAIEALASAAESRERDVSGHGEAVAQYSEMIGRALRLPAEDLRELGFAGRVHDVGKMFIAEKVLNKRSSLTDEEFNQLKAHARLSREIVSTVANSDRAQQAVEFHHECFDGSGYPQGLHGEAIPLWARIVAVADAYVNLTSERALSPGKTSEQAIVELERSAGIRYDGMLVRILARELKSERSLPNLST